jgi:porin
MSTTSRTHVFIVIVVVVCSPALAQTQDASQAIPAGTRSIAAETPFQLTLPSGHLLGDWAGMRTGLEDHGITPTWTLVTDALGNPTGGERQGFTGFSNVGVDLQFDLEKLYGPKRGSFEISISYRFERSLTREYIGNLFNVQQVCCGATFRVVDFAYQQQLLEDRLSFRVGRMAVGDDFLVSPYDYVWVQNGFCGTPVGIFFNSPGMTAYPNAAWGALVKGKPTKRTYVMGGLYNGDPSIRDNIHHGLDWSMRGPLFAIGEVGYQANGLRGDQGREGNYKAGLWYDNSQFTDFNTVARGHSPSATQGNWGFYGLFDQVLIQFGERGESRGFGVTGSLLISPDQAVSQIPFFSTAGFLVRGIFPSRPMDVGGFGVVFGYFSNDLQDSQRRAGQAVQQFETALEFTYRLRFLRNALFVQPDLQYIIRPGGTGRTSNAVVLGAQIGFNF